jgi:microcystin-dependent protein
MPTYLENNVGLSSGTTLIGGTGSGQDLVLKSTSDSTKGSIFIAPDDGETIVSGRTSTEAINSSARMFAGVVPKMEIQTNYSTGGYEELVVVRHNGIGSDAVLRRVGVIMKMSDESSSGYGGDGGEGNKMGGMVLESSNTYANSPKVSLALANYNLLTIFPSGNVGIDTNPTDAGYKLDVAGTLRTTGAITAASLSTSGNATIGGTLATTGLLSANGNIKVTVGSDATGDMYYRGSGGNFSRVGIGSAGQVLTAGSGAPVWSDTQNLAPVGSYLFMATETAPDGYLRCDGSSLTRVEYPDLFDVIGTTYGNVDGSTFNLPDTRGLFFRDLDNGRGIDPSRALSNTYQSDAFKEHNHTICTSNSALSSSSSSDPCRSSQTGTVNTQGDLGSGKSIGLNGGTETRPVNIAIVTFIKYGTYFNPF